MKIIYNKWLPFKKYSAMMFFGRILARKEYEPLSDTTINHEEIHKAQAGDFGLYIMFYAAYFILWLFFGYQKHPMEREAYKNEDNLAYLLTRRRKAWQNL